MNNIICESCEKCNLLQFRRQATTKLIEDQHYLQHTSDHNHAVKASQINIIKTINILKERIQQTNDKLVQIIQSIIADTLQEVYLYLSSHNVLHQSIKRIRNVDLLTISESLRDLVIPKI
ncbi:9598_t:CDS:2 [Funneliformis caledonium]|uniref:9598_t:CDS:1 n=1 Tax=Funneliformis caledonium TaxID=1117310 RepID=A0A9N9DMY7_9GLOM|nr:9598_t:CDS:2 [Funneliformis caledonium]